MTTQSTEKTKGSRNKSPFLVTFGDGETFGKKPDASTKFVRVASKANSGAYRDYSVMDLEQEVVIQLAAKGLVRELETKLRNDLNEEMMPSEMAAEIIEIADDVYKRVASGQVSAKRSDGSSGAGRQLDYDYYADVMTQLMRNTGNTFSDEEREQFISHLRDDCDAAQRKAFILEMSRDEDYKAAKAKVDIARAKGRKANKDAGNSLMQKLHARIAKSKIE